MSDAPQETVVQPTTTEAVATAPVVETPDPSETPEQKVAREANGKFRSPLQPRIDELTRQKHEAKREADYWRQRAEAAAKPPEPPKVKPTPDKFDNYGEYVEELSKWNAKEVFEEATKERDTRSAAEKQASERASNWVKNVDSLKAELPDYHDVMATSEVPVTDVVKDLLLDSELGPRIAYHLTKNPDAAEKLNAMTEREAAREIGRLEIRLAASAPTPASDDTATETEATPAAPTPPVRKTTSAPAPATPVSSGRSTTPPLSKMSMDDYVKARVAQGASWARRG